MALTEKIDINFDGHTFPGTATNNDGSTVTLVEFTITNAGTGSFRLDHDYFLYEDLTISTATGGGGTVLTEDVDYTLDGRNSYFESEYLSVKGAARKIADQIRITNATHQTGTLYISGKYFGDYMEAGDFNLILSQLNGNNFYHVQDQKPSGTTGGNSTAGAWVTRTLNTEVTTATFASLAANQITLDVGTYYIEALAPARNTNSHKAKWYNITDASDEMIGTSGNAGGAITVTSDVSGTFVISSQKTFELQQRFQTAVSGGLGVATSFGVIEVYTDVRIWKLA